LNPSNNRVPGEDFTRQSDSTPADDKQWIDLFKNAKKSAEDHQTSKLQAAWSRNYRAFANRHFNGSKYDTYRYRSRSKLFKPKTRAAVRKNDATAAASMFSTEDVVSITPERASDKLQMSMARFLHEDLNYRLDRSNKWAGPNWFLTAIGARQDTQLTGICVSKQYWEYEERVVSTYVDVQTQTMALDETGMPIIDMATGQPVMTTSVEQGIQDTVDIVRDRPMITLIPPEHALIDRTGDWRDPIQEGGFFIAAMPARIDDVEYIVAQQATRNVMGGGKWRDDIDLAKLRQAKAQKQDNAASVRRARGDGIDPYDSAFQGKDNETVWLYEVFYRKDGEDWHFWMLGDNILLSDPRPTIESYPEQFGDRPYVRGLGALEAHKTHPMAPVESWQPLQMEINDTTNLALDAMKMSISPITKIMKGRGVDLKQVQNRGPDAAILVQSMDDVTFDRAPSPDGNSQMAVNIMSNDMDELAGVFAQGSVQSNRMLNETVGGMQLLSASAGALTEFDLRVWVETWVEPVLSQVVKLIKHYESDEVVISVAGDRAGLIENLVAGQGSSKKPLDPQGQQQDAEEAQNPFEPPITIHDALSNLDKAQVAVKVNVGIGALDTTQRMQKFMGGVNITKDLAPLLQEQGIQPNGAALLQEAWGLCGYKDGDRFFTVAPPKQDDGPPPEAQLEMLKQKGTMSKAQLDADTKLQIEHIKADVEAQKLSLQEREFAYQQMITQMSINQQQQTQNLDYIMRLLESVVPGHAAPPRQIVQQPSQTAQVTQFPQAR
jgi:hypothetical protein